MLWGWEGNRRRGIALAICVTDLSGLFTGAHGLRKGDEHPAYTRGV